MSAATLRSHGQIDFVIDLDRIPKLDMGRLWLSEIMARQTSPQKKKKRKKAAKRAAKKAAPSSARCYRRIGAAPLEHRFRQAVSLHGQGRLAEAEWAAWFDPASQPNELLKIFQPADDDLLQTFPVTRTPQP